MKKTQLDLSCNAGGLLRLAQLLLICSLLCFQACSKRPQSPEHVRLSVNPTAFFLPLFVAHDQGFFAKHGVESEILMLNSTGEATNAFLKGDAEVSALGAGGLFFLDEKSRGKIKLAYVQYNRSYALIVPKDSPIHSIDDLKGKRIGSWPSPTPDIYLHLILDSRIGASGFTNVPVESRFLHQTMMRGDVDAIFAADVHAATSIATGTTRFLSQYPMEEFVEKPFFHGGGILRAEYIKDHPSTAKAVIEALDDAIDFIHANPEKARDSLVTHIGVKPEIAASATVDDFTTLDKADFGLAQKLADDLTKSGILKGTIDVKSFRPDF